MRSRKWNQDFQWTPDQVRGDTVGGYCGATSEIKCHSLLDHAYTDAAIERINILEQHLHLAARVIAAIVRGLNAQLK